VLFWFIGVSPVIVWRVFADPAVDYRLVMAGSVLPDLVDVPTGGGWVGHTLVASVILLTVVMLVTRGRRPLRRHLLALPIGAFLHLLLDGVWAVGDTFWWPLRGGSLDGGDLPSLSRPLSLVLLMEACGAAALAWFARRFRLHEPQRLCAFLRNGRLGRDLVA
jgi:hypothetical protein